MRPPTTVRSTRAFSSEGDTQVVSFRLGDSYYAVDVREVDGVYHGLPLIPSSEPGTVSGHIQLSRDRIPVMRMRSLLGYGNLETKEVLNWVVVVHQGEKQMALDVEAVERVIKFTAANVKPSTNGKATMGVRAIVHSGGRDYHILDTDFLFSEAIH